MKPSHILSTVALLSACTSAWPWPPSLSNDIGRRYVDDFLGKRQQNNGGGNTGNTGGNGGNSGNGGNDNNNNNNDAQPSSNNNGDQPAATNNPQSGGNQGDGTITNVPTRTQSGDRPNSTGGKVTSGDGKGNGTITAHPTSTKVAINPLDPAGGISMISPNALAGQVYYKIGQPITWAWNYTSLLRPPTAIDVLATASAPTPGVAAPSPFTIAQNMSYHASQTVTWDTGSFITTEALPMGTYTLIVYDAGAKGGVTAFPSPGYLGVYEQFTFGMYSPQPRIDLTDPYICNTCNAAGGAIERLTLRFLFGTVGITVASFLWFTGGLAGLL